MKIDKKRVVISLAGVAIVAALAYAYLARNGSDTAGPSWGGRVTPVVVAPVVMAEFVDSIEAIGTALASESIIVESKVTESVKSVNFADGQRITKGDIIIELNDVEASADLAEAIATLSEAEKQYERAVNLVKRGSATQQSLDSALSAQQQAQARVQALESRLSNYTIEAPFDGVLGLRMVSPGTVVGPGDQITTLDDISVIKLDFSVPETFFAALRPGLEVIAKAAAYSGQQFSGKITAIDPRIDAVTRSVKVRAELPNPDGVLKPGMLLTTTVLNNQRQSMRVPEMALVPIRDQVFVFVVKQTERGATVERKEIKIGARRFGSVEVLSGLVIGDQVVIEGTGQIGPGSAVRIIGDETQKAPPQDKAKPWQS